MSYDLRALEASLALEVNGYKWWMSLNELDRPRLILWHFSIKNSHQRMRRISIRMIEINIACSFDIMCM